MIEPGTRAVPFTPLLDRPYSYCVPPPREVDVIRSGTLIKHLDCRVFDRAGMGLADYIGRYWAGAEILYGAIIAMSVTSSLREYPFVLQSVVLDIALAAHLCSVAWGLEEGLIYLWERDYIHRRENRLIELAHAPGGTETAVGLLGEQLDSSILHTIPPERRAGVYERLAGDFAVAAVPGTVTTREVRTLILGPLVRSSFAGAVVIAPFFLIGDAGTALLASNVLGVALLFAVGYSIVTEASGASRVASGLRTAMVGIAIAAITIAVGK